MISFRVDGRSGVPPYLQIVQQVRQALRMGVLSVGDQLPTVREARQAGLDDESIESLLRVTLRADSSARDSDSEEIA